MSADGALDVIIIGAGPAGIATARTLLQSNPLTLLLLLEARDRIGGRAHTDMTVFGGVPVDLGASWIHHYHPLRNPIVPLVEQQLQYEHNIDRFDKPTIATAAVAPPIVSDDNAAVSHHQSEAIPRMITAVYCGLVDSVDDSGYAVVTPSPCAGLGGGIGRFILFDGAGRVDPAVYSAGVKWYNHLVQHSEDIGEALHQRHCADAADDAVRSAYLSYDVDEIAETFLRHDSMLAKQDTSVLTALAPHYTAEPRTCLHSVVEFLLSGTEQFEGAPLDRLGVMNWQSGSDGSGAVECDMLVQRGYGRIIQTLADELPIKLRHVVNHIDYSNKDIVTITATTDDQQTATFTAKYIVITVPLGVLKKASIRFTPPLPAPKQLAIDRMGFGLMNKIVLQFDHAFWDDDVISIGYAADRRGVMRWFLSLKPTLTSAYDEQRAHKHNAYPPLNESAPPNTNILVCFVTGQVAIEMEETYSDEEQVAQCMTVLRSIFNGASPNGTTTALDDPIMSSSQPCQNVACRANVSAVAKPVISNDDTVRGSAVELLYTGPLVYPPVVPDPIKSHVTRWWTDPFTLGSYAHFAVGAGAETVRMLGAHHADGRVGWAGEHTSMTTLGCVDSAWESGIREGRRLSALLHQNGMEPNGS